MPTSLLKTIANDLNRQQFHAARKKNAVQKVQPSTMLAGRQSATTVQQLEKGVAVTFNGASTTLMPLRVGDTNKAATDVLSDPNSFLTLEADNQIPLWIRQQRLFSLPDRPAGEAVAQLEDEGRMVLRLPPAILHEAERHQDDGTTAGKLPLVSFCRVVEDKSGTASYQKLEPLKSADWQPAILVRCPMKPALHQDGKCSVFELHGIPQDQRWYLDQLKLLLPEGQLGSSLPKGAKVRLWLEKTASAGGKGERSEITQWVLARRNLTELARPGENSIMDEGQEKPHLPYAVKENDDDNTPTVLMLQMGSITNSGGYFFRVHKTAEAGKEFTFEAHTLTMVVTLPHEHSGDEAAALPMYANALAVPANAFEERSVVRFEGDQHIVVESYVPMGCVAFGWRRKLPEIVDSEKDVLPTSKVGFARAIHLVDYEARDQAGALFNQRINDSSEEPCDGNTGPALSPAKLLSGQTEDNTARGVLKLDADSPKDEDRPDDQPPTPKFYYYRNTIRVASIDDGYSYFAKHRSISVKPAHRDIFGNRLLLGGRPEFTRALFYTDALLAPSTWPGFAFRIYPSAEGQVTLEAQFAKPELKDPKRKADTLRQLKTIHQQLEGVGGDVEAELLDAAEIAAGGKAVFRFTQVAGSALLKEQLIAAVVNAIAIIEQTSTLQSAHVSCAFTVKLDATQRERPRVFQPVLRIRRTAWLPDVDALLTASESEQVRLEITRQVITASNPLPLAGHAFANDPEPTPIDSNDLSQGLKAPEAAPSFRDVALAFHAKLGAAFTCQTAVRRNRFNEHEVWFVPDELFPRARGTDAPLLSTARPLMNVLGADTFEIPDFSKKPDIGEPGKTSWHQLKRVLATIKNVDYDALARRSFDLLETLADPLAITERTLKKDTSTGLDTSQLLWDAILHRKFDVASTLGNEERGYILPFFDGDRLAPAGVTRMGQDAYRHDLRLFYGIDAMVQWPLSIAASVPATKPTPLYNFYGKPESVEFARKKSDGTEVAVGQDERRPTYSDFVLNLKDDCGDGINAGHLTMTYNLPPGDEAESDSWVTKELRMRISHLQLPLPDVTVESKVFNQGQWLELVSNGAPLLLAYNKAISIPSILRRFPQDPMLNSCSALTVSTERAVQVKELPIWGWELGFQTEADAVNKDTVFLEMEYGLDLKNKLDQNTPQGLESGLWTSKNLLQALHLLGSLASMPSTWWTNTGDNGPLALQALPELLGYLNGHLTASEQNVQAEGDDGIKHDRFEIKLSDLTVTASKNWGRQKVSATRGAKPGSFAIKASLEDDPTAGVLHLFTNKTSPLPHLTLRPNLRLKRNTELAAGKITTPALVYECGPVFYPEKLRVAARRRGIIKAASIKISEVTEARLISEISVALLSIFGAEDATARHQVRVDCRHVFKAGAHTLTNSFKILPLDLLHPTVSELAEKLAKEYLARLGADAMAALGSMTGPELELGIQVMNNDGALLEVEAIRFEFIQ